MWAFPCTMQLSELIAPNSVIGAKVRLIIKICRINGDFYSFILPSPFFYVIGNKITVRVYALIAYIL